MAVSMLASALEQAQVASLCLTTFLYGMFGVREEEILSSLLTPECPLTGFFFALFVATTAIAFHNASESTRQQRMKVLPVSIAMFLLATLVRHPSLASTFVCSAPFSPSMSSSSGSELIMDLSIERERITKFYTKTSRI